MVQYHKIAIDPMSLKTTARILSFQAQNFVGIVGCNFFVSVFNLTTSASCTCWADDCWIVLPCSPCTCSMSMQSESPSLNPIRWSKFRQTIRTCADCCVPVWPIRLRKTAELARLSATCKYRCHSRDDESRNGALQAEFDLLCSHTQQCNERAEQYPVR